MDGQTILGLVIVYSWVHAIVLQVQKKKYKEMTGYEQTVSIVAITGVILIIIGLLM